MKNIFIICLLITSNAWTSETEFSCDIQKNSNSTDSCIKFIVGYEREVLLKSLNGILNSDENEQIQECGILNSIKNLSEDKIETFQRFYNDSTNQNNEQEKVNYFIITSNEKEKYFITDGGTEIACKKL